MSARLSRSFLPRLAAAASLCALPACSGDGLVIPGDGSIARLVAVAGDGQRAVAGHSVPEPLVVRAVDRSNRPVTGAEVTFRFINADGRVAPGTASTGADGQATAEVTLGGSVGSQVVEARLVDPEGLAVEFQLTALQQETPAPPNDGGNGGNGNGGPGNGGPGNGGNGHGDGGGSAGGSGGGGGGGGDVGGGGGGGSSGGDGGNGGGSGNHGKGHGHRGHGDNGHGHHGHGEN